jgi:hypothetical protein
MFCPFLKEILLLSEQHLPPKGKHHDLGTPPPPVLGGIDQETGKQPPRPHLEEYPREAQQRPSYLITG